MRQLNATITGAVMLGNTEDFACKPKQLLNSFEERLHKTLIEYFTTSQNEDARRQVFAQVRLCDFIHLEACKFRGTYVGAFSVDFVITNHILFPEVIIELDGPSHDEEGQRDRDQLKNEIAEEAGIALLRFRVEDIREHILSVRALAVGWPYTLMRQDPSAPNSVRMQNVYPQLLQESRAIEPEDIELALIQAHSPNWPTWARMSVPPKSTWTFPPGWKYVTAYPERDKFPRNRSGWGVKKA